jgi:hypothetical protein
MDWFIIYGKRASLPISLSAPLPGDILSLAETQNHPQITHFSQQL